MPQLLVNEVSIRECFVPRPGYCFLDIDIEGLELATLAQTEIWLINSRRKADRINDGQDLHCHTMVPATGWGYEECVRRAKVLGEKPAKNERNLAKVTNFGKPGGMANKTLVSFARTSYGLRITEQKAEQIGSFWEAANPDDVEYLAYVRTLRGPDKLFACEIPGTVGLRRGRATYCAIANTHFQGLGAVVAGNIDWALTKATMSGNGALRRCRVVNMVYDQWLLECPIGLQTDAAKELEHIVIHDGGLAVPDLQLRAEACAMDRWSKAAERTEKDGELLIWSPKPAHTT